MRNLNLFLSREFPQGRSVSVTLIAICYSALAVLLFYKVTVYAFWLKESWTPRSHYLLTLDALAWLCATPLSVVSEYLLRTRHPLASISSELLYGCLLALVSTGLWRCRGWAMSLFLWICGANVVVLTYLIFFDSFFIEEYRVLLRHYRAAVIGPFLIVNVILLMYVARRAVPTRSMVIGPAS
jgi:hypothetical protein